MRFFYAYIFLSLLISSCRLSAKDEVKEFSSTPLPEKKAEKKKVRPDEYIKFFSQTTSGLVTTRTVGGLNFKLKYKTPELLALKEVNNLSPDAFKFDSVCSTYGNLSYYSLEISSEGVNNLLKYDANSATDYERRLKYYAFEASKDIFAETKEQVKLPCTLYHFERSFGISPAITFTFAINDEGLQGDKVIVFEERVFGKGRIKLRIEQGSLNNIPTLDI